MRKREREREREREIERKREIEKRGNPASTPTSHRLYPQEKVESGREIG